MNPVGSGVRRLLWLLRLRAFIVQRFTIMKCVQSSLRLNLSFDAFI